MHHARISIYQILQKSENLKGASLKLPPAKSVKCQYKEINFDLVSTSWFSDSNTEQVKRNEYNSLSQDLLSPQQIRETMRQMEIDKQEGKDPAIYNSLYAGSLIEVGNRFAWFQSQAVRDIAKLAKLWMLSCGLPWT